MPTQNNTYSDFLRLLKLNVALNIESDTSIVKRMSKTSYYNPYVHTVRIPKNFLDSGGRTKSSTLEEYITRYSLLVSRKRKELNNLNNVDENAPIINSITLDDTIPALNEFTKDFLTDSLIYYAAALVPEVNSTKLTSGTSFRNVRLCEEAYKAKTSRADTINDVTYVNSVSVLNCAVYVNTAAKLLIMAFRGTDIYRDIITDLSLASGYTTDYRFTDALALYQSLKSNATYSTYEIQTTGHSLGGTLGLYLNNTVGIRADVFDPAVGIGLFKNNPNKSNASAHIVKGDIVSPFVATNNVVSNLYVYPVENSNYGYYGYHVRSNFFTLP